MRKSEKGDGFFISTTEENFQILFQAFENYIHDTHIDEKKVLNSLEITEDEINKSALVEDFLDDLIIEQNELGEYCSLLDLAIMAGLSEVADSILKIRAKAIKGDERGKEDEDLFKLAVKHGHQKILDVLIKHGFSGFVPSDKPTSFIHKAKADLFLDDEEDLNISSGKSA